MSKMRVELDSAARSSKYKGVADEKRVMLLREVFRLLGEFDNAISTGDWSDMDIWCLKEPPIVVQQIRRGMLHCLSGKYNQAIKEFRRALKDGTLAKTGLQPIYLLLGYAYFKVEDFNNAAMFYSIFFSDDVATLKGLPSHHISNYIDACVIVGTKAYMNDAFDLAQKYWGTVLKVNPDIENYHPFIDSDPDSTVTLGEAFESISVAKKLIDTVKDISL
jgi:tetratricopeptide (TPR) repeat protein